MKKGLVALFIITIVCTFSFALAARFSDVPSDMWASKQIERWADEGMVVGYEDGNYKPDNLITRAEFSTLIVKLFEPVKEADLSKFKDLTKDDWFYSNLAKAVGMGAITQVDSTSMRPNAYVTRQEAVVILNAVLKFSPARLDAIKEFTDYDEIASYAESDVEVFAEKDYVVGYPDKSFKPAGTITRAEAASILDRIFKMIAKTEGTYDCTGIGVTGVVIVKADNCKFTNADQVGRFIFINESAKKTATGISDDAKMNAVVINAGENTTSKTTGRTSGGGGGGGGSEPKTLAIKIKDNNDGTYAVTSNGVTLEDGGKFSVIVKKNGEREKYVLQSVEAKEGTIFDNLVLVADEIMPDGDLDRLDRFVNTIESGRYGEEERIRNFAKTVILEMILSGEVTLAGEAAPVADKDDVKTAAGGTDLLDVYNVLSDDTKLSVKDVAIEEARTEFANGEVTYDEVLAKLSSF